MIVDHKHTFSENIIHGYPEYPIFHALISYLTFSSWSRSALNADGKVAFWQIICGTERLDVVFKSTARRKKPN